MLTYSCSRVLCSIEADEMPAEFSEVKLILERFTLLESTRGGGKDRGGEIEYDESDYIFQRDVKHDRLGSGRHNNKDDAFADDEDDV